MKIKALLFSIMTLAYLACDDTLSRVGTGILPDQDRMDSYIDTIYIDAVTVQLDSIYAKTINGLLGEYYDPSFGNLKAGYLCQFYSSDIVFPDTVIDNRIDSVTLTIIYNSSIGDTLTPMEVSVYPIVNPLHKNYYSNIDPSDYCDLKTVWGKKTYTAHNMNISDEYREKGYMSYVAIQLPVEIGYQFLEESRKPEPNAFSTLESFTEYFKGLYIAPTFGTGNILQVYTTYMSIHFQKEFIGKDIDGADSAYVAATSTIFTVTKEVIQLNKYTGGHDGHLLLPDDERTYIKTPVGIFTKLIIPIPEIVQKVGKKKLSNVKLSLTTFLEENWDPTPSSVKTILLINPDSVTTFFENQIPPDNLTYFSASYSNNTCNFTNLSNAINTAIKQYNENPEKNLELLVMPVTLSTYVSNYSNYVYATSNYFLPLGLTFKKGEKFMRLAITATDLSPD